MQKYAHCVFVRKIFGKTCLVCVGITILKYENLTRQNGNIFLFSILKIVTCSGSVCPVPLRFNIVKQTWEGEISLRVRVSTLTLRWEQVTTSVYLSQPTNSQRYGIKKKKKILKGFERLRRAHLKLFYELQAQTISSCVQHAANIHTRKYIRQRLHKAASKTTYAVFYFPEKHCNRDGTGLCWHSPMFLFFLSKRLIRST